MSLSRSELQDHRGVRLVDEACAPVPPAARLRIGGDADDVSGQPVWSPVTLNERFGNPPRGAGNCATSHDGAAVARRQDVALRPSSHVPWFSYRFRLLGAHSKAIALRS
ncbi:hypothetical protein GCM10018780_11310 [Streptomyces lanatus]|nr:hypothetical protein GCM10018780_11310 [Streptomyces lanatus]